MSARLSVFLEIGESWRRFTPAQWHRGKLLAPGLVGLQGCRLPWAPFVPFILRLLFPCVAAFTQQFSLLPLLPDLVCSSSKVCLQQPMFHLQDVCRAASTRGSASSGP